MNPAHATSQKVAVIDLRGDRDGSRLQVAGLPVLLRNLLLLQRQGFARAVLLCDATSVVAYNRLAGHRRLTIPVSAVDQASGGPQVPAADALLYWPGEVSFGRFLPGALSTPPPAAGAVAIAGTGVVWASGSALEPGPVETLPARLQGLAARGAIAEVPSDREAIRVVTRADAANAERALLRSLRKPADGVVANYNRYVSLAISKWLLRLPVTPNHATIAAGIIGILCGVAAAQGGYWWMLLGALGFHFNAVIDGIDGEIARSKLLESRLGQWLDTVADDLSNIAFVLGAGIGCYRTLGWSGYVVLGVIAAIGQVLSSAVEYHYVITVARSGDLNDFKVPWESRSPNQRIGAARVRKGLIAKIDWIFRRDAFIGFASALALVGQLRLLTWGYAIGANIVWSSVLGYRALQALRSAFGRGPQPEPTTPPSATTAR
jgi:phosphatidylglycerophosphate synthase